MKQQVCLGYQVATPEVPCSESLTCLSGSDLEGNIRLLHRIGYDAVELMVLDPKAQDAKALRALLDECRMKLVMVCTGEIGATLGLTFTDPDPAKSQEAVNRVLGLIDLAADLGANLNVGRVRGQCGKDGADRGKMIDAIRTVSRYGAERNVEILLEPIQDFCVDNINTLEDGVRFCEELGEKSLLVMADYAAMAYGEPDMLDAARKYGGWQVVHVHLSEADRWYPGRHGSEHFRSLLEAFRQGGYDAPFVVECRQQPDPETAARRSFETLAPILSSVYGSQR